MTNSKSITMKNTLALLEEFQNDPQAFIWRQVKEVEKFKKAGFPIEVALQQVELDYKKLKLRTDSHYSMELEDNSNKLKDAQGQSGDLNTRHNHYTASEKEGLADKHFVRLDKLKAGLTSLKSRFTELKKYMSNTKNK